jgi:hypothetical protein
LAQEPGDRLGVWGPGVADRHAHTTLD